MLTEILGVKVPQKYLKGVKYASSREFIEEFNNQYNHVACNVGKEKQNDKESEMPDEVGNISES